MQGQQQGRGTLVVLGLIALGTVVALAAGLGFDPRNVLAPADSVGTAPPAAGQPSGQAATAPAEPKVQTAEAPKPAPAPPPAAPEQPVPSFDVVRVEPNGESVIAGRSAPGATIEMLREGQVHARTAADQSGLFALVPPPLPPGSHQVTLQSIAPDGTRQRSRDAVTIVVSEGGNTRPLVAMTSPDKPTVLLSNPEAPEPKAADAKTAEAKPADARTAQPQPPAPAPTGPQQQAGVQPSAPPGAAADPQRQAAAPQPGAPPPAQPAAPRPEVKITTVEAEEGGRLYVSGQAAPGSTVRLYLNETFIAPGGVGADGKVAFAIGRGVRPGDYRVRIDDVDPVSGAVKSRAEVAFNVPVPVASAAQEGPAGSAPPSGTQLAAAPTPPSRPSTAAPQAPGQGPTAPGGQAQRTGPGSGWDTPAPDGTGKPPGTGSQVAGGISAQAPGRPGQGTAADPALPRANGSQVASATAPDLRDLPPGTIVVPDVSTAIVSRGDNLWRISQRVYGKGVRYTVIYSANQGQIRNPNLIYPGQVFVLPGDEDQKAP
ncbi:MAG TPA: LysM peptidoglycan-binding domain-containing protein [Microvirga sp.]|nr:LysM peptidoglycan-binding domain-containing protein [Microvirga sp.]